MENQRGSTFRREISRAKKFNEKMMELIEDRQRIDAVHLERDGDWRTWVQNEIIAQLKVIDEIQVAHENYSAEVNNDILKLQTENDKFRAVLDNVQRVVDLLSSEKPSSKCNQLLHNVGTNSSSQLASTRIQCVTQPEVSLYDESINKSSRSNGGGSSGPVVVQDTVAIDQNDLDSASHNSQSEQDAMFSDGLPERQPYTPLTNTSSTSSSH